MCLTDGTPDSVVALEEGIPEWVAHRLEAMGHPVTPISGQARALFGRGQVILMEPETSVRWAGSDPRADGCAVAQV